MDRSRPGRRGVVAPALDAPEWDMPPADLLRDDLPLPEVSQPEVVRYFTLLSQLNFSVDTNFYPLGSCTMKYNPRINEDAARVPGMAGIHPLQQPDSVQGALELMHGLQGMLAEITGMEATSLVPLAGAHGELAGVLMIRAYHQAKRPGPAHQDAHTGQRAWHQPGVGGDGRLRRGQHPVGQQGQHGPGSPAGGQRRRPGWTDDNAAQHAWPFRHRHFGRCKHRP